MSENRAVVVIAAVLVAALALIVWGQSVTDGPQSVPSKSAATPSASAGPAEEGCPADLKLPAGVDPRVCEPVAASDVTTLEPTDDPQGGGGTIAAFRSPGGSLACAVTGESAGKANVECAVASASFAGEYGAAGTPLVLVSSDSNAHEAAPPESAVGLSPSGLAITSAQEFSPPVLQYGDVVRLVGHFCTIQQVGVSCWNPTSGTGLFLSQDQWASWGPKGALSES